MQIPTARRRTIQEHTPAARAKSVQFVPLTSRPQANENPGALAGATGAVDVETYEKSPRHYTRKTRQSAMSLYARDGHKRAAKALGFALTIATERAWLGLSNILEHRLSTEERAALAFAALRSLDDHTAYLTASAALFEVVNGEAQA